MKLVDAHIHFSDVEYAERTDELVAEARRSDVEALVSNSMDLETSIENLRLAEKYLGVVYPALGIHPWNVTVLKENELEETLKLISEQSRKKSIVAIGEIGLDYKYGKMWDKQLMVFDKMLRLAEGLALPVIIHSRGTTAQIVDMLPSYNLKRVLLHWFSHPMSVLSKAVDNGYFITEGPPSVFSSGIREIIRRIPLTNLLTETDGPVRFGGPFKGKMTTPSFIPLVIEAIAQLKEKKETEVADQIFQNFTNFFGVKSVRDKRYEEGTIDV